MKRYLLLVLLLLPFWGFSQLNISHAIHTGRSRLYFGNYTGAIQSFNLVIKINPHLPEPYFYRGVAKLNLEDFRGAKSDLDKAIDIKPFYAEAFMYRGVVYYNLKEYELALKDYSTAIDMDGENAEIFNNMGICKAAMRNYDGAIDDYTRSIELKPKNFNAYLNRSIAYQIQEKWDKAISDCNNLIRIRPNSAMGYLSRGLIKVEKNDFASALRDFDMAVYMEPKNAYAFQNRAMVKQQLGSHESAIMDYDMALSIDPQLASAYFNRGISKEMIGRDGFQSDYDHASLLDPRFAKRPWQTPEEKEKAQQQQLMAWKQQIQQQNQKGQQTINQPDMPDEPIAEDNNDEIDLDLLNKRRIKANLVKEENNNFNEKGRIQYKNVRIELLPNFEIAVINKSSTYQENVGYFNMIIENINSKYKYDPYLTITNKLSSISTEPSFYRSHLSTTELRIQQNASESDNYLHRGIYKSLTGDYHLAIADFSKAISLNERNLLSYFMRANTTAKMISEIERLKDEEQNIGSIIQPNPQQIKKAKKDLDELNSAYSDILTDYSVVLYMNPQFYFGYFNRGNIYCRNEKYIAALDEYDKALKVEPDFAEALYNRGLVRILLNDIEGGAKDLSRAGELGIDESYNIIKRYCN